MTQHHFQQHILSTATLCISAQAETLSFRHFWQDVLQQQQVIAEYKEQTWALWQANSYDFLVLLFAGLLAGKALLLPPNRVRALELELEQQQIYFLQRQRICAEKNITKDLDTLQLDDAFLAQAQLYFYTSGSTGQPKKIPRTLQQLLCEVQGLAQAFDLPSNSIAIATVSHQHIYGLLFKLLWPLAAGHHFYLEQQAFPEDVVEVQKKLLAGYPVEPYVISSPALLKRWSSDVLLNRGTRIFSSGGRLEEGVRAVLQQAITEIFGSSETGGIAYRHEDQALWHPFADVELRSESDGALAVKTQHAYQYDWILTGDQVQLLHLDQGQSPFQLLGRLDRIVKLEEKRLSLDQIEHEIGQLQAVIQCHVLVLQHGHRQILACVAVLTAEAQAELQQMAKANFVQQLKTSLTDHLEQIAIPRQWRFLSQLPLNSQAKLDKKMMQSLFAPMQMPVVLQQQRDANTASYQLEFMAELTCFAGHFPNNPIYPGVGQIAFIQALAKQTWADLQYCSAMEQIKFQQLLRPYTVAMLELSRNKDKISFRLKTEHELLATGRLAFACTLTGQEGEVMTDV